MIIFSRDYNCSRMNTIKPIIYKSAIDIRQIVDQVLKEYEGDEKLEFYMSQILERVERILTELRKW